MRGRQAARISDEGTGKAWRLVEQEQIEEKEGACGKAVGRSRYWYHPGRLGCAITKQWMGVVQRTVPEFEHRGRGLSRSTGVRSSLRGARATSASRSQQLYHYLRARRAGTSTGYGLRAHATTQGSGEATEEELLRKLQWTSCPWLRCVVPCSATLEAAHGLYWFFRCLHARTGTVTSADRDQLLPGGADPCANWQEQKASTTSTTHNSQCLSWSSCEAFRTVTGIGRVSGGQCLQTDEDWYCVCVLYAYGKGRWELLGQRIWPIRAQIWYRVGPADCPRAFLHQPLISWCLGLRANGKVARPLSALVAVLVRAGGVRVRDGNRGAFREYEDCELRQGGRLQQLLRLDPVSRSRGMRYLRAEYLLALDDEIPPPLAARLALSDLRQATVIVRHGRPSQVARIDWWTASQVLCEAADPARTSYQWHQIPGLRYQGVCLPALVLLPGIKLGLHSRPRADEAQCFVFGSNQKQAARSWRRFLSSSSSSSSRSSDLRLLLVEAPSPARSLAPIADEKNIPTVRLGGPRQGLSNDTNLILDEAGKSGDGDVHVRHKQQLNALQTRHDAARTHTSAQRGTAYGVLMPPLSGCCTESQQQQKQQIIIIVNMAHELRRR
ncbi:hypothetical protein TgHK011_006904 [Trichoderma gracile]|nr:hypothetical protein TgHK011_006904 [Trichoderma gracile]